MDEVMEQIIDKMSEITDKMDCREFRFKIITTETEVVKFRKFNKLWAIRFSGESKEMKILYDDKIFSVKDFLNLEIERS